tara:strand:- start:7 stop:327 length:321 start_codon:yes stop_codon:yes gene_type:complete
MVQELTDTTFKDALNTDLPVIIDFWAPWCGPCIALKPSFEKLAGEYKDKAVFAKVNTEEHAANAAELGIRAIPTLIIFKKGEETNRHTGGMSADALKDLIDEWLKS